MLLHSLLIVILLAGCLAEEAANVEKPEFVPTEISAVFLEQFSDDWETRWSRSQSIKKASEDDASDDDKDKFRFDGEWKVEEPTEYPAIKGDKGLVLKSVAKHHALVAKFNETLDNKDKTLVLQYEVKMQNPVECGGAYLKLLTHQADGKFDPAQFDDKTPYTIMFGPDKCGGTNKVHFIFRHKNPITGEYEEKHLKNPPAARITKLSTLYTLVVRPDNTFEIQINGEKVSSGNLLEDFDPPVNPPKEIEDENDKKPADWVHEARIEDPDAKKPDDWDESEPYQIPDTDAKKPDDWIEDEPVNIPDPDSEKPEDWDEDEDGEWIAPMIPNPKCEDVSGCGPWVPPLKNNPAYKGKWYPPLIDNPAYKGVWKPRLIPNPDYYEDTHPASFEKIDAVGFELWTMQNEILFDNIYVGHSEEDSQTFAKETWVVKNKIEKELEKIAFPDSKLNLDDEKEPTIAEPVLFFRHHFEKFYEHAQRDPLEAITNHPAVVGGLVGLLMISLGLLLAIFGIVSNASTPPAAPRAGSKATKKPAAKANEDETSTSDAGQSGDNKPDATGGTPKRSESRRSRKEN